ncbi:S-layer homology domain-containing protein [Tissierella praeacuta]|uniref:S-layer homology domain-containing protein n=1 Tax=Tissierella praeacuta TaxID=43131 RepID=UPI0028A5D0E0|nr:S-layer homology domain-containing protein [Tissierella praeacuta]
MKKISIMLLAAVVLIGGLLPSTSYAKNDYDKKLEEAIIKVKKLLNISDKYDTFISNVSSYEGNTNFYLNWTDSTGKLNNIDVNVDIEGNIISYNSYSPIYKEPKSKLPNYTKDEAQKFAMEFINKIDSSILNSIKLLPEKYPENTMDTEYRFNFSRYVNDIQFPQNSVSITVNKYSGDIENYYVEWDRKLVFPSPKNVVSLDKGKEAYRKEIGIKPIYKTKAHYGIRAEEKNNYYLAYSILEQNKAIDAYTGKKIELNHYGPYYGMREELKGDSSVEIGITPVEQESIDKLSGLLDEKSAEKKARELLNIDIDYKLENKNLYGDFKNPEEYIWSMYFYKEISKDQPLYIQIGLDAKTGEILNFNTTVYHEANDKSQISKDKALNIAKEYIKKMEPSKFNEIELIEEQYREDNQLSYNFQFIRKDGEIYVENDSIRIGVDGVTGKVISYNLDWFRGKLPSKDKLISIDKAYDILWNEIGLELIYVKTYDYTKSENKNSEIKLVYTLKKDKPIIISGITGEILDYSGKAYKDIKPISYKDINNSYAKNKIITLAEYGIGFKGEEFKPKDKIKQKDFVYLLWKSMNQYIKDDPTEEDIYKEFISSGYMKEEEKNPNKIVTKEEAVKYILRVMKIDKVAEIEGIYKEMFKDDKDISKDLKGYINIAYGLKIITGDGKGNIKPRYELNREDAANMIYKYIFNQ